MITVGKLPYGETTDRIGGGSCLLFGGVLLAGHLLCCLAFCPEYGTQRGQCPLPGAGLSHCHHGSLCMVQ